MPRRTLRSTRGRRPYVEAFPALGILELEREIKAGRRVCQWTNESGVIVGHIHVIELSEHGLVLEEHFLGAPNVGYKPPRFLAFKIRRIRHNANHNRPSIVCPLCGRSVGFVYNVAGLWSCKICHDLIYINRILGPVTRLQRRFIELDRLVARGRPHYGRKKAFEELKEERARLMREIEGAPPLHPELRFGQYPEWLSGPKDPRVKHCVEEGELGYGWTRFDEGGFKRLTWIAEQEVQVRSEAQFAQRDRAGPTAVRQGHRTGPNVEQQPFAPEPQEAGEKPRPFRFDPSVFESEYDEYGGLRGSEPA